MGDLTSIKFSEWISLWSLEFSFGGKSLLKFGIFKFSEESFEGSTFKTGGFFVTFIFLNQNLTLSFN